MNIEEITDANIPSMHVRGSFAQKVKYLCSLLPSNEWSGILFYKVDKFPLDKNFPDITCEDLLLMDVGGATTTEFTMNSEVAAYMAENPDLIDCQTGLIHSHANMQVFYSGTDLGTLEENGKEVNHFVSVVVNDNNDYLGAITRNVSGLVYEDHKIKYSSFNNEVGSYTKKDIREYTEVQYCIFDVTHADEVELSQSYKDYLFERVERLKKEHKTHYGKELTLWDDNDDFFTGRRSHTPRHYNWVKRDTNVDLACLQLVTLNPFADQFDTIYLDKYAAYLPVKVNNRFPGESEEFYHQYLGLFIDTWIEEIINMENPKEFLEEVIDRLQELNQNSYTKNIIEELVGYLDTLGEEFSEYEELKSH